MRNFLYLLTFANFTVLESNVLAQNSCTIPAGELEEDNKNATQVLEKLWEDNPFRNFLKAMKREYPSLQEGRDFYLKIPPHIRLR